MQGAHPGSSGIAEEERLVEAAVFGEGAEREAAWCAIMERLETPLLRVASRTVGGRRAPACLEEFWQVALTTDKLGAFLRRENRATTLEGYLGTAIRNFGRRELLRLEQDPRGGTNLEDVREPAAPASCSPAAALTTREAIAALRGALATLTPLRRLALILTRAPEIGMDDADTRWLASRRGETPEATRRMLDGLASTEGAVVAEVLRVSPASVYQHVHRGEADLARLLEDRGHG